jgi:RNA polymerase sigma-70 factor (ECF subfamily)
MTPKGEGNFPNTHWTLLARTRSADASVARGAIDEVCANYHYPLYCYIRRSGLPHHDAEDALHDFFNKLLRLGVFSEANPERGHLRALLATALRRFLQNWKRDRPYRHCEVSSDATTSDNDEEKRFLREQFIEHETPERIFDRKWGLELLTRVVAQLSERYAKRNRTAVFDALRPALAAGGTLRGGDTPRIAAMLGITENALHATLSRLLKEYREILESEV